MTETPRIKYNPRLATLLRWIVVALYMGAVAFLTLSPGHRVASLTLPIRHFDKLAHTAMHGGLAFLFCWALRYRFRHRLWLLYVVIISHGYGTLMELGQYHMPYGRTFSWGDIMANTVGAILAVGLLGLYQGWKERDSSLKPTEPAAATRQTADRSASLNAKRLFDLASASLGLLALSPLLLIVALLVRLYHGSPVLFRQTRPGLGGQPFELLKFRTMTEQRDESGELLPDEQRLTRLGRFLRTTSLDELPELINVVKGDMSLVGPRPLLMRYLERYTPEQARRHQARPGITGWAQVNGRNAITWDQKFEYDVWYVEHQNFWLDLKILLLTLRQVVARKGISADDHATMPEFMGEERERANRERQGKGAY